MDTVERRVKLRRAVVRLLQMIDEELPDQLVARGCVCVLQHGIATLENLTTAALGDWLICMARANCNQCPSCGADIDHRRNIVPLCGNCITQHSVDSLKTDLGQLNFDKDDLLEEP